MIYKIEVIRDTRFGGPVWAVQVATPNGTVILTPWLIGSGTEDGGKPIGTRAVHEIAERVAANVGLHYGTAPDGSMCVGTVTQLMNRECADIIGPTPSGKNGAK